MHAIVSRHGAVAGVEVFKNDELQATVNDECPSSSSLARFSVAAPGTMSQVFFPSTWFPE